MLDQTNVSKHIQKYIKKSEKKITIMFTDIKASTQYWSAKGNINGRVMVDYHNRLIYSIIKKFQGKVVKTIGDAFMVMFKNPENAVKAAITIQQKLHQERRKDKKIPRVCIGIHSGRAIVEKGDVYGDMVNVASRIENRAKAGEVLVSYKTVRHMSQKKYYLEKKDRFTPKGKKKPLTVLKCNWRKAPKFITGEKLKSSFFINPLQRWQMIGAGIVTIFMILFLCFRYIRYFLLDLEVLYLMQFTPKEVFLHYPVVSVISLLILLSLIYLIIKIKFINVGIFKLVSGGLGYCVFFFLFYFITSILSLNVGLKSDMVIYHSEHIFVEIMAKEASVYEHPLQTSPVIKKVTKATLFLQNDVLTKQELVWNKVLLGIDTYGWVKRIEPPKMGVPEKKISLSYPFTFRYLDVYNLAFGLLGFVWGFFRFKMRPM
ncbi:MAG: adenylate/guanylate cyclase domain-containing protein [bacterium]